MGFLQRIGIGRTKWIDSYLERHNVKDIYTFVATDSRSKVKNLLEHGADINAQDKDGNTLLHVAVRGQYKHMAQILILKDIDVNKQDKNGKTALHIAAENGNYEICKMLLEKGANVHVFDTFGNTPFHYASKERALATTSYYAAGSSGSGYADSGFGSKGYSGGSAYTSVSIGCNRSLIRLFELYGAKWRKQAEYEHYLKLYSKLHSVRGGKGLKSEIEEKRANEMKDITSPRVCTKKPAAKHHTFKVGFI